MDLKQTVEKGSDASRRHCGLDAANTEASRRREGDGLQTAEAALKFTLESNQTAKNVRP